MCSASLQQTMFKGKFLKAEEVLEITKSAWNVAEDNVTGNNYLSGNMITLSLLTLQEHLPSAKDVAFVSPDFFHGNEGPMNYVVKGEQESKFVLFPRAHNEHWTLWCLNVSDWSLTHYNSMRTTSKAGSQPQYLQKDYIRILKSARHTFKPKGCLKLNFAETPASHRQKDGFNCGVFVLDFAKQIMLNGKVKNQPGFDVAATRQMVATLNSRAEKEDGKKPDEAEIDSIQCASNGYNLD
ncbi:hypothetical protein L596_028165 [Steinernema carpocapsae]|uniref:Ubiquitin-like protease family profile domain-containing protein n=1 Tax=Steinernema carpocapsae TaxID=34508 RepID=A0A4U5LXQ4_STECR|nr:hypothetical protein L596_028165 [Steinernema carpocapsae]